MEGDNQEVVCMPGEKIEVPESILEEHGKVVLGPGIRRKANSLIASKAGVLRFKEPNVWWIDNCQKRVSPTFSSVG